MKLKTKLVLTSICVSALMCAAVTMSAMVSVRGLTPVSYALPLEPAEATVPTQEVESVAAMMTIEAQRSFNVERIYVMVAIIAAGALCTYLLASQILKPLERLTAHVKELTPETLSAPFNAPKTTDETGKLSLAFLQMTQKLYDAYELQKSFSAAAAHELRTPLSIMSSELDVYNMEKTHTNAENAELINGFSHSVERLRGIVEDLLCFTSQSTVSMSAQVCLQELIGEIVLELTPLALSKEITIIIYGEAFVNGDDSLLQRVFYNLIENAIKYNTNHGEVIITLSEQMAVIADSGNGISSEDEPFIFEPFYRADKSRSRAAGGSGLGLAIAKQIIEKHSGTITYTQNEPRGSCFTVNFKQEMQI